MKKKNFDEHRQNDVEKNKEEARAERAKEKELKHDWYEKFEDEQLLIAIQQHITSNRERWMDFNRSYPISMKDFDERSARIRERTEREREILERMMTGNI